MTFKIVITITTILVSIEYINASENIIISVLDIIQNEIEKLKIKLKGKSENYGNIQLDIIRTSTFNVEGMDKTTESPTTLITSSLNSDSSIYITTSSSFPIWLIALLSIIGILLFSITVFIIVRFVLKRRVKNKLRREEECLRDIEMQELEVNYSYTTIPVVPLYEAKALAAANKKLEQASFIPSLPPRLSTDESNYDYAYN